MLTLPIHVSDILSGKITKEEIIETREELSKLGKSMKYVWPFKPLRNEVLQIIRCRGCGGYFNWTEMHLEGRNRYRNTCPTCYAKVYAKGSSDGLSSTERQVRQGTELYGGKYWAYMILTRESSEIDKSRICPADTKICFGSKIDESHMRHADTKMYFGSTSNIISRLLEHSNKSSNPPQRLLFEEIEKTMRYNYLTKSTTFQVFPFDTFEEAREKEKSLYRYWKKKELETKDRFIRYIVLNVKAL